MTDPVRGTCKTIDDDVTTICAPTRNCRWSIEALQPADDVTRQWFNAAARR